MEKANVPKFGSFKPPKAKAVDAKPGPASRSESSTRRESREEARTRHVSTSEQLERKHREHAHGRHGQHGSHDRPSEHRAHEVRHRSRRDRSPEHRSQVERNDLPRSAANSAQGIHHADPYDSDLFVVDRRGDPKNVEYGSLHRYSIAAYRRTGYGHVVGLSTDVKIDREASTDKEVCLMNVRKRNATTRAPRLLTSKYGRSLKTRYRLILPKGETSLEEDSNDYIDLHSSRKRQTASLPPEETIDYRSIEGKARAQPDDEDAAFATDSDTGDVDHGLDQAARQHSALLSRQIKAAPKDLSLWLALIEHQETLVKPGEEVSHFTSSERRTLADLRIFVAREALNAIHKGEPGYEQLLLTIIDEGRFIWDSNKRASKWHEALTECPSSTLLWTRYLDFAQDGSGFRYDTCKEAYVECLRLLRKAVDEATDEMAPSIASLQTYVLLRYTKFVREAGYQELSASIWQAVLEWHYHMPKALQTTCLQDQLAAFEDFWDSECPRVGDQHAQGWQTYHAGRDSNVRDPHRPSLVALGDKSFDKRVAAESDWNRSLPLSTTAEDDAAVEDPFRYVMFSDIRDVLEACHDLSHLDGILVRAVLCFLGLPPVPSGLVSASPSCNALSWYRDTHLAHHRRSSITEGANDNIGLVISRHETAQSLFEDAFPADLLGAGEIVSFVACLLERILATKFDEDLAEYYLAFKWRYFGALASKAAKELLKTHSTSLRIYNTYAVMLVAIGEGKEMQKPLQVWSTAVHMRANLPEEKQDDVVVLFHSRLLSLAKFSPDGRAPLSSLMMICEPSGDTKMQQLRVRRELESSFDRMHLAGRYGHASLYADLLAWLAYLTSDHAIDAALATYGKYARLLSDPAAVVSLELLLQYKARLLSLHIARKAYKPSILRDELDGDLRTCPSNSILLALRSCLADQDRLRELVKVPILARTSQPDIVQWFVKLVQEVRRVGDQAASGATENNIRATFSNAVLLPDSPIKHAPALWMVWLEWEFSRVRVLERQSKTSALQRVKRVILDGIRYIPWHKGFILRGLECLIANEEKTAIVRQEHRQMYDMLVERGLRIRYDIESAS